MDFEAVQEYFPIPLLGVTKLINHCVSNKKHEGFVSAHGDSGPDIRSILRTRRNRGYENLVIGQCYSSIEKFETPGEQTLIANSLYTLWYQCDFD